MVAGIAIAGIVVAGGAGRRMGGVDKAVLAVAGVTLLDRVLAAARPVCDRLVVVGPSRPTAVAGVTFVVEDHPGGGPAPAVLAGVAAAGDCEVAVVLAGDLPVLRPSDLARLVDALLARPDADAAASAEERGLNPLLAAYRVPALLARAAGAGLGPGSPASRLLPPAPVAVDLGPAAFNVNRPEDLAAAEALLRSLPPAGEGEGEPGEGAGQAGDRAPVEQLEDAPGRRGVGDEDVGQAEPGSDQDGPTRPGQDAAHPE